VTDEDGTDIYLIPEACLITGVEESTRNSPTRYMQMRELVNATCIDMQRRFLEIKRSFLDVVTREPITELADQSAMPEI
jgi:hypothetical protein